MPVRVSIDPLSWESDFFGCATARLTLDGDVPLAEALQQPYTLWQVKVPAQDSAAIDALQPASVFSWWKAKRIWRSMIKRTERQTGVRIAREAQIPQLRAAAAQAFSQSRFRAPWYDAEASGRFYAQWIENAVRGTFDHQCLIACDEQGALQGFVSHARSAPVMRVSACWRCCRRRRATASVSVCCWRQPTGAGCASSSVCGWQPSSAILRRCASIYAAVPGWKAPPTGFTGKPDDPI